MGRSKRQRGSAKRTSAQVFGEVWDKTSAVDSYDGRKNLQAGDSGFEGGKWNSNAGRRPVIISRDTPRSPRR